ncbi:hypothetical protein PMAYCL1PPCAC_24938, partial [Pristionchus mayeri]
QGFIKDGRITFEARFTLSNIVGIRTAPHFDFTDSDEPYLDVALLIGGEKVYVSKQILAIHSPVFHAMFFGDFSEKNKDEIELKDVDREYFRFINSCIYTSYIFISVDSAEYLLHLSDRFEMTVVLDQVEKFLVDSATLDINVKLMLSDQYRLVNLQVHLFS